LILDSFLVYDSVMQTNKKSEINRYLTRAAEKKPMDILDYINRMNSIYGNGTDKKTSTDQRTDSKQVKPDTKVTPKKEKFRYLSWADGLKERTRPAKKAPVKIVKKPKPTAIELLEFEDYLNTLDPNWWEPEEKPKPEDKTLEIRTGITKLI